MSIAHVKPRNAMVTCPYNPAHRVENGRLPRHLLKCQKQNDTSRFSHCPFNATHVVPFAEKASHMSVCPDKAVVERQFIHTLKASVNNTVDQDLLVEPDLPQSSENWELESGPAGSSGYDPTKQMQEQKFHNPNTFSSMTKSQKKEFRLANNCQGAAGTQENDEDQINRLITAPLKEFHLPREDGLVARSMQALSGVGDSSPSPAASRQSSYKSQDIIGSKTMLGISKGRGLYRVPDSLPKVGLQTSLPGVCGNLPKVDLPPNSQFVNDCISTTSEENDIVRPERLKNRLQKKLKMISVLIEKQENGAILNREELEKIGRKAEILRLMQVLPN